MGTEGVEKTLFFTASLFFECFHLMLLYSYTIHYISDGIVVQLFFPTTM